jgi:hypothetical protein
MDTSAGTQRREEITSDRDGGLVLFFRFPDFLTGPDDDILIQPSRMLL